MNVNPLSALSNTLPGARASSGSGSNHARNGSFEQYSRDYGPVVATAIGTAEAAGAAVESVYEFSTESLAKLGRAAGQAADAVVDTVEDGLEAVGDAAESIVDGAGDALQSLGAYATLGVAAGKRLVHELA